MNLSTSEVRTEQHSQTDSIRSLIDEAVGCEERALEERRCGVEPSSPMFHFARTLRSSRLLADMADMEALEFVRKHLDMEETFADYSDPQASFVEAWNVVKFPAQLFERAIALSQTRPIPIDISISKKMADFIALVAALQQVSGDVDIFLSVDRVGEALNVSPRTVSTYIRIAEDKGWLRKTKAFVFKKRAAEFRFCGNFKHDSHDINDLQGNQGNQGNHGEHLEKVHILPKPSSKRSS